MFQKTIPFMVFLCTAFAFAQPVTQQKLEEEKAKIHKQIIENEILLIETKTKEKSVLKVIDIKEQKIHLKENLIYTNEKQSKLLYKDMYKNQLEIKRLNNDLEYLKKDYADMIVKSYKSRSEQSRAMFLLSAENFLQAYKRFQYMKQYTNFRKMQGNEIIAKTQEIKGVNQKITIQKMAKEKLIEENLKEKTVLLKEKQEQQKVINDLKKNKKKIAQEIKQQQNQVRQIDRQIDRLIREAIAEANRKAAKAKAKANPTKVVTIEEKKESASTTKIALTSEGKIESDNFKANRSRLPWPVERGVVSLGFGDQPHPLYPSLKIHNSGIEIMTDQGTNARAVFAGEVTQVQVVSPVNKAVIIKHGDFFTVYQNLSKVTVREGDKVSIKQSIGQVRTSGETGKTVMKFMISQNTTYINPTTWLSPM